MGQSNPNISTGDDSGLAAGCSKTPVQTSTDADLVQEQRIQSDIWEALDTGEVDFGTIAMDDVEIPSGCRRESRLKLFL